MTASTATTADHIYRAPDRELDAASSTGGSTLAAFVAAQAQALQASTPATRAARESIAKAIRTSTPGVPQVASGRKDAVAPPPRPSRHLVLERLPEDDIKWAPT